MATLILIRKGVIWSLASVCHPHLLRYALYSPIASTLGVVQHKSTDVDVFDIFTSHILKQSSKPQKQPAPQNATDKDRSEMLKKVSSERQKAVDSKIALNVNNWNQTEIDHYLIVSMDCNDRKTLLDIVDQMIELRRLPTDKIILRVLSYLCDDSDDSMVIISHLIDLCQDTNMAFYAKNMEFAPFLSQYLWKLERFDDALNTLNSIYTTTNKAAKSLILQNFRQIIYDAVKNRDENVIEKIVKNAEQIYEKFTDPTLINCVWSDCFFSELFYNQRRADELFQAHERIRGYVSKNIGWIALTLLQQHNVDGIHRLIEVCLAAKMKREVGICLTSLFDYHYWRDDLRSCSEVMNTCLRLGTAVSNGQNQKLLNLLLKKKPKPNSSPVKIASSRFEFKF